MGRCVRNVPEVGSAAAGLCGCPCQPFRRGPQAQARGGGVAGSRSGAAPRSGLTSIRAIRDRAADLGDSVYRSDRPSGSAATARSSKRPRENSKPGMRAKPWNFPEIKRRGGTERRSVLRPWNNLLLSKPSLGCNQPLRGIHQAQPDRPGHVSQPARIGRSLRKNRAGKGNYSIAAAGNIRNSKHCC